MEIDNLAAVPQDQPTDSAPVTDSEQVKTDGQEQPEQPKEQAEKPAPEPKGVQKRLDELRRQAGDAQRMNERLLALMEKTLVKGEAPKANVPSGPPRREDFDAWEDYAEAKADWQIAQRLQDIEQRAEAARKQQYVQQKEDAWKQREAEASKRYADYDEVVADEDLSITPIMAEAIKDSERGADVAYFLGKNPDEADRISRLSPAAQVRELGKIEARLELKPVKSPSKAPPPIEPVGGGKAGGEPDLSRMSQAEYEAYRAKNWAKRF